MISGAPPLAAPAVCEASSPPQPSSPNTELTPMASTIPSARATTELKYAGRDGGWPSCLAWSSAGAMASLWPTAEIPVGSATMNECVSP